MAPWIRGLHVGTRRGFEYCHHAHVGVLLRGLEVGPCSGVWWDNRETGGYAATRVAQIALKLSRASIIQAHPFYKCNSDR